MSTVISARPFLNELRTARSSGDLQRIQSAFRAAKEHMGRMKRTGKGSGYVDSSGAYDDDAYKLDNLLVDVKHFLKLSRPKQR